MLRRDISKPVYWVTVGTVRDKLIPADFTWDEPRTPCVEEQSRRHTLSKKNHTKKPKQCFVFVSFRGVYVPKENHNSSKHK
jgi:hypothetical protein